MSALFGSAVAIVQRDWVMEMGDKFVFACAAAAPAKGDIEADRLIRESLMYAKELERIV